MLDNAVNGVPLHYRYLDGQIMDNVGNQIETNSRDKAVQHRKQNSEHKAAEKAYTHEADE